MFFDISNNTTEMKLVTRVTMFLFLSIIFYLIVMHYYELTQVQNNILSRGNLTKPSTPSFSLKKVKAFQQNLLATTPQSLREIVLAVVVCGDRLQETLVMLKSAIVFSTPPASLKIVIITEPHLIPAFNEKLGEWQALLNNSFQFETRRVAFPGSGDEWRRLFKPCAAQRLFLPSVLDGMDSVLYVDTDVVFVAPVWSVWAHFERMNSTQLAALSPEHEDPNTGWYNRFARHPYYGPLGVNSGVMLMNLTRMREFRWESYLTPILREYRMKITWGDQDIINIIFHYHPERLYVYDCRHNYRSDHCMYMSVCREAEKSGARVIHGSRGSFHSERQPAFRAVYSALEQYELGTDPYQNLVLPLTSYLQDTLETSCGRVHHVFLDEMKKAIPSTQSR